MHWKDTLPEWYIQKYGYQPCINIGTSGHVDYGKTTLIEAITGVWTSGHSEELRRGITIKVGYADAAFYKCQNCEPPSSYSVQPKCNLCDSDAHLTRVVSFRFPWPRKFDGQHAFRWCSDGWVYTGYCCK